MNIKELLSELLQFSKEREWFEFKTNWFEEEKIGQYIYIIRSAVLQSRVCNSLKKYGTSKPRARIRDFGGLLIVHLFKKDDDGIRPIKKKKEGSKK